MDKAFYIYKSDDWRDISSYVSRISKIPYINSNRDSSPIAEGITAQIQDNCGYTILKADRFKLVIDDVVVFAGLCKRPDYDPDKLCWEVQIDSDLMKLKDKHAFQSVIYTTLSNTGGDLFKLNMNDNGYHCLNILWMLQCFFVLSDMTLDISDVENEDSGYNIGLIDVLYKHFCFDLNMLYAANSPVAISYQIINEGYADNVLTLFEIFADVMSTFGFGIVITDVSSYKLIAPTTNYSYLDDYVEGYKSSILDPEVTSTGYYISVKAFWSEWIPNVGAFGRGYLNRSPYYNDDVSKYPAKATSPMIIFQAGRNETAKKENKDGRKKIESYDNLIYGVYGLDENDDFVPEYHDIQTYWGESGESSPGAIANPYRLKVLSLIRAYQHEEFIIPMDITPRTVLQNFLDIENEKSEIIQESYV